MGKLPTFPLEDLWVLLLALLIVFGPAAMRLLAALIAFRAARRLRHASNALDRLIQQTEQRLWQRRTIRQNWRRLRRGKRTPRRSDGDPAILGETPTSRGSDDAAPA
jgi:hypothetical protein